MFSSHPARAAIGKPYGLSLLLLAVGLTLPAMAVSISVHDRGPCPNSADGVCVPNRKTFGFYSTQWRPWPGRRPHDATEAGQRGRAKSPHDAGPYELPPPDQEDTFGQPNRPPMAAGNPTPGGLPGSGQPPIAAGESDGDLPPQPPLDSEDAPPVPPPGLRDQSPTAAPPQGPPPPAGPPARPPLGMRRPLRQQIEPTSGQQPPGLIWRERSSTSPVSSRWQQPAPISSDQRPLSSSDQRPPSTNPLRANYRRPSAEEVAGGTGSPAPSVRQVAYVATPEATQPQPHRPAALQGRLRPNPLRQ